MNSKSTIYSLKKASLFWTCFTLPKSGFKSLTVSEKMYDEFESIYKELKELGKLPPGINSFSGYVVYKIENYIQEQESLQKLASKIMTVPTKFTDNKITIKILN